VEKLNNEEALIVELGLIAMALKILEAKRSDYSGKTDPYRNLRSSEFVGVPAWKGTMIRNMDKFSRRRSIMEAGGEERVKDESFLDTLADSVNYIGIEGGLEIELLPDISEMMCRLIDEAQDLPRIVTEMVKRVIP
jgi:hypothetical protein